MACSKNRISYRRNLALAKRLWFGQINREQQRSLKLLSENYGLSIAAGDLQLLENRWYVTHSGLLRLASRKRCAGIQVDQVDQSSDPLAGRWVFKATVFKSPSSKGFVGYGDADPTNISSMVRSAELRIAETRAVNRALRKAYGIGLCSVEELGALSSPTKPSSFPTCSSSIHRSNGENSSQPRLRDRLCLLIRQHNLDPNLVKTYAADYCGTETLRGASRDLVESFINELAKQAEENRDSLICKLNSYAQPQEVTS